MRFCCGSNLVQDDVFIGIIKGNGTPGTPDQLLIQAGEDEYTPGDNVLLKFPLRADYLTNISSLQTNFFSLVGTAGSERLAASHLRAALQTYLKIKDIKKYKNFS